VSIEAGDLERPLRLEAGGGEHDAAPVLEPAARLDQQLD